MFGSGLLKGLGVTIKHFVDTYVDDVKAIPSRYAYGRDTIRQMPDEEGLFTIQYPEEKRELPERFRYIPMLIYDTPKQEDRCTACGICAKVCPPQCIWIVRDQDEKGKPVPRPAGFFIDASICMSCGFCSEFCPFDAIKMNHDYELAVYDRYPNLVYDLEELTVPLEYYASLYPTQFAEEEKRRAEEEAAKAAKAAKRAAKAKPPAEKKEPAAAKPAPKPAPKAESPAAPAAAATIVAGFGKPLGPKARTSGTLSYEELERRRAIAYENYKARKGADAKVLHVSETAAPAAPTATLAPEPATAPEPTAAATPAPEPDAAAPVAPEAATTSDRTPGQIGRPLPPTARTSGTLSFEELEERRKTAYENYKERKGSDAKQLD